MPKKPILKLILGDATGLPQLILGGAAVYRCDKRSIFRWGFSR
jgi:hypothetical protein